jgi:hypothetical protein
MADHDQRFKTLLHEFLGEFFQLFFPEWAARFDFSRAEWLTQEVFADPPQGQRRAVDLVAKLPLQQAVAAQRHDQPDSEIALIHVEVESAEKVTPLRARMYDYYKLLRDRHRLPVVPVALYLKVGPEGIGWDVYEEHLWERRILHFEYLYVGLPALDGERYVAGESPLGAALAALMRVPAERRAWLKAEALRRIEAARDNNWRKLLLCECVDAYLRLDPDQQQVYDRLLHTEPYRRAKEMTTIWHQQGFEQGLAQGQRQALLILLEDRFGPLQAEVEQKLQSFAIEQLRDLLVAALHSQSLKELGLED